MYAGFSLWTCAAQLAERPFGARQSIVKLTWAAVIYKRAFSRLQHSVDAGPARKYCEGFYSFIHNLSCACASLSDFSMIGQLWRRERSNGFCNVTGLIRRINLSIGASLAANSGGCSFSCAIRLSTKRFGALYIAACKSSKLVSTLYIYCRDNATHCQSCINCYYLLDICDLSRWTSSFRLNTISIFLSK